MNETTKDLGIFSDLPGVLLCIRDLDLWVAVAHLRMHVSHLGIYFLDLLILCEALEKKYPDLVTDENFSLLRKALHGVVEDSKVYGEFCSTIDLQRDDLAFKVDGYLQKIDDHFASNDAPIEVVQSLYYLRNIFPSKKHCDKIGVHY